MARFPNYGHPPAPTVGTGGFASPVRLPAQAPVPTLAPDPMTTGGVGPRMVSFTAPSAPMSTLAALQQRQDEIRGPALGNITQPSQGWSYLANQLVSDLEKGALHREEMKGQQELTQALTTGLDPNTGQLS